MIAIANPIVGPISDVPQVDTIAHIATKTNQRDMAQRM